VYSYSKDEGDFHAENIRIADGRIFFDFVAPDGRIDNVELGVPVEINIENAIAAMSVAWLCEVPADDMRRAIASYMGAKRRFEFWLRTPQCVMIDDYAHHPDELKAAIQSVKLLYPQRKLSVIFQPHLYTRTRDFAPQFAQALSLADEVILLNIYPARELPIEGVTSHIIFDKILSPRKELCTREMLLERIKEYNFEVLLTMGAGDIDRLLPEIYQIVSSQ
jgi:UDP-N-acetylmuramate--alanine ligase